jgi:predicted RNase H-like HicB family nuclease
MTYRVMLKHSEEGYAVWCPALRGCCSQGDTREEALANIKSAIQEWMEASDEVRQFEEETEQAEVAV